ncbi:MAG: peptide-methionine (S)-S-oxide reductase MsrA [Ferruginibacter sp.]|nr:peptide-methionine (S)-S-oxide reductase MsrA [Ferruginibacter sp.]
MNETISIPTETATLGNGCFWCTEAVFQQLEGVIKVTSGYSGGETDNPDYKSVCSGTTGHAECLEVVYDPTKISFEDLLEIFWKTHDPTTLNRQGNDIGTQYRSVIFYHSEEQKVVAEKYMEQLNQSGTFPRPIVTLLQSFTRFFPAEDYHQNYFKLNGNAPYCQFVVRPKVEKFLKTFPQKLRS